MLLLVPMTMNCQCTNSGLYDKHIDFNVRPNSVDRQYMPITMNDKDKFKVPIAAYNDKHIVYDIFKAS